MRFIIREKAIRQRAVEAVKVITSDPLMQVEIKPFVDDKTAEQRGWFHKICGLLGMETGYTKEQTKNLAKGRVFGLMTLKFGDIEMIVPAKSSESLNKKEYSDLIEEVYLMAGEAGFALPPAVHEE